MSSRTFFATCAGVLALLFISLTATWSGVEKSRYTSEAAAEPVPQGADNEELLRIFKQVEDDCACAEGRTTPIGAYVTCMDCRVDVGKVLGSFDKKFSRTHMAGCVLSDEVIESLRLTVLKHDVRVIMVLDHTDCAVRTLAEQPTDWRFERLQRGRLQFDQRLDQIVQDKMLKEFFQSGRLVMVHAEVDIKNKHAVKIIRKFGLR